MRAYIRMGVPRRMAYLSRTGGRDSWSRSRKGGWAQSSSPMMSTTVTLARLKRQGYIVFSDYYQRFYSQLNRAMIKYADTLVCFGRWYSFGVIQSWNIMASSIPKAFGRPQKKLKKNHINPPIQFEFSLTRFTPWNVYPIEYYSFGAKQSGSCRIISRDSPREMRSNFCKAKIISRGKGALAGYLPVSRLLDWQLVFIHIWLFVIYFAFVFFSLSNYNNLSTKNKLACGTGRLILFFWVLDEGGGNLLTTLSWLPRATKQHHQLHEQAEKLLP